MTPAEIAAGLSESQAIVFVEGECVVGGVFCGAWSDWFWASVDADPACNVADEDGEVRDPVPLTNYLFDHHMCHDIAHCPLRARAVRAILEKEAGDAG